MIITRSEVVLTGKNLRLGTLIPEQMNRGLNLKQSYFLSPETDL